MTTSSDTIEVTAATVDQAISQALAELGADQDDVTIEVLSTPRAGLLGLGARPARVRVTRRAVEAARSGVMSPPPAPPLKPPAPRGTAAPAPPSPARSRPEPAPIRQPERTPMQKPPAARTDAASASVRPQERERRNLEPSERERRDRETMELETDGVPPFTPASAAEGERRSADLADQAREATAILKRILELMGERAEIELARDAEPDTLELNIKADGSGLLIGRHGQTLDALEYLLNRILARKIKDAAPLSVDSESYRARRRAQLHRMALSKGEQAKREHVAVTLEPMPARDRRIIHLALKDDPLITTRSAGEGFMRTIQIVPDGGERREGAGAGRERNREAPRGQGRPRQPERPRQQGQARQPERPRQPERAREPEREQEQEIDGNQAPLGQQGGFKHGQKRIV